MTIAIIFTGDRIEEHFLNLLSNWATCAITNCTIIEFAKNESHAMKCTAQTKLSSLELPQK